MHSSYANVSIDKHRRSQRDIPIQTMTDACFIYRRQPVKVETSDEEQAAIINRGREIAREAADIPTIPASMPNYTRDQIRELYGELDKKTRRLHDDEYTVHSPVISNSSTEKVHWKLASPKTKVIDKCPLPKFRLEDPIDNDDSLLLAAYLSTGLSNPRSKLMVPADSLQTAMINASVKVNEWANNNEIFLTPTEKDLIRGSFRTAIGERTPISPSPLLLDLNFNLKQLAGTPTGAQERPTFLEGITNEANVVKQSSFQQEESRRPLQRHDQMLDTNSSSPDSMEIIFDTTPSTPGSCGMYLEPYMRQGYDLPTADHHVRDSSWQHAENDDSETVVNSMKDVSVQKTLPLWNVSRFSLISFF